MKQCIAHVTLVVRDYDEAIRFFTECLDFELLEDSEQPEDGKRWVVVGPRGKNGVSLLLARAVDERQASAIGQQAGGRVGFFLQTDDFWRDFRRYESRGVRFVRPPADMPYGTVAVFEDLCGNRWDLIEYAERMADDTTQTMSEGTTQGTTQGTGERTADTNAELGSTHDTPEINKRLTGASSVSEASLQALALTPTTRIPELADPEFQVRLSDAHFMRVAVQLARKSFAEGGCPIGAVIIDTESRQIIGKGHNTLVQESHPYNHGETAAMRDAGRVDFSRTTLFTSLSPCDVCTALILQRGFRRVVVGDVSNASGNESVLQAQGVQVDVLEDAEGVALYARFRAERPELELEDWQGLSAVGAPEAPGTKR